LLTRVKPVAATKLTVIWGNRVAPVRPPERGRGKEVGGGDARNFVSLKGWGEERRCESARGMSFKCYK